MLTNRRSGDGRAVVRFKNSKLALLGILLGRFKPNFSYSPKNLENCQSNFQIAAYSPDNP
jgi:hypothetical protein